MKEEEIVPSIHTTVRAILDGEDSPNFKARSIISLGEDAVRMMYILHAPMEVQSE